ncbi:YibE/F family protein [Cellulomonas soli]|uniref:YibE/F family protein n=1 Tax=Cellulomonas soli TaxID=931535 RepID=UPI003F84F50B
MSETRRARPTPGPRRAWTVLLAVVVPVAVAAVIGMVLTWPGEVDDASRRQLTDVVVELDQARVTATTMQRCDGSIEDVLPDGTVPAQVDCLRVTATVTSGPRAGQTAEVFATAGLTPRDVPVGTGIVLQFYPEEDGAPAIWAWHDFARAIPLGAFALAFALVTVLVAGARGVRALIGLGFAFGVLAVYVLPGLVAGENAAALALCGASVIVLVVLYLTHGVSLRTTTALVGTLAGLGMVAALGAFGAHVARLDPVTTEDAYRLAQILGTDGPQILRGVFLCGVVLAGLGVLNDVTITQASAVWELRAADPSAGWRRLFTQGMSIGRDHIASTVYTIAFAYTGASLPVLLLLEVYGQPFGQTITSGPFAEEVVRTLAGSIGLVLAIPLTTLVAALVAVTASTEQARDQAGDAPGHLHAH